MREVWRQAHLKQPLGSRDGSRTRQRGGSGLKSTTGGSRGGSSAMARAGGVLHQRVNKRPHMTEPTETSWTERAAEQIKTFARG